MSLKTFLLGAVLSVFLMGCASASYFEGESGRVVAHSAALGQSLAYSCEGASISGIPNDLMSELMDVVKSQEEVDIGDVVRQIGFTQLPHGNGLCVVARGGPIDQEIQGILRVWLWKAGIDAVADVLGEAIDLGETAITD